MSKLLIVESPTKAKTLQKYLGRDFEVKASVGHIKDLPKSKLGVDVEKSFAPSYVVIRGKAKVLAEIRKAAKASEAVYLGPDPDREGEAIAWHIAEEIGKDKKGAPKVYRVLFNEITKNAVRASLQRPLALDQKKFESQQARRILDRLVGYQISPLLWQKVRRGLSAGRVQSVAVRIIVEREREIEKFVPEEYWSLTARLAAGSPPVFEAKLFKVNDEKAEVKSGEEANRIADELRALSFRVGSVDKKERRRYPPPPFTTSTLQQEAGRKLRYTAKRTMAVAQRLYEGVEVGEEGAVGLITYMRTDSVRVADEALQAVREHIASAHGKDYLPASPHTYKSKKLAQEAHEAIRPASLQYPPAKVKKHIAPDEYKLYTLIWNRFVASQMQPAVYDQTTIDVTAGKYLLRATGSVLKFDGYLSLYAEGKDEAEDEEARTLPEVQSGEELRLVDLAPAQHFTQPPPRFTEASLVKELEEDGIGRPSTYASILSTIQSKGYVQKVEARFKPTELGVLVTDLLVEHFPEILGVQFTARMEENLDGVEEGTIGWQNLLAEFYGGFRETLERAHIEMRDVKREEIPTDLFCEKCGKGMIIKWGRNGSFLACSGYPDCRNTKEYMRTADGKVQAIEGETTDEVCPECGSPMAVKRGRFGRFLACTRYPECKGTKAVTTGIGCPEPGCGGMLTEKRSKRGKVFYSCSNYPKCKYALWDKPVARPCPLCNAPFLTERYTKRDGASVRCVNKDCGYTQAIEEGAGAASEEAAGTEAAKSAGS
jgi:DNA topoisomerase-1